MNERFEKRYYYHNSQTVCHVINDLTTFITDV